MGGTIINEFDIEARPAESAGAPDGEDGGELNAPASRPEGSRVQETERLLCWHNERSMRIRAY